MITDKEIADERNEVKMLRLRIAKHKACERLREIERKSLNDPDEISDHIINKNLRRIRIKQQKTIDELTETTGKLEGRLSSMYAANSDQDTTINKLNALLADEKMTLAAYRNNPLSDQVADRDNRIEQSIVLNEALRIDMELAHNLSRDHIAGQDRFIKGLKTDIEGLNSTYRAYRDENDDMCDKIKELTKDLNLKIKIIGEFKDSLLRSGIEKRKYETTIDELNSMYCDACGKLEQIENFVDGGVIFTKEYIIDEITKIIQEE